MKKSPFGVFEITLPASAGGGKPAIPHNSKVKVGRQAQTSATAQSRSPLTEAVLPSDRLPLRASLASSLTVFLRGSSACL